MAKWVPLLSFACKLFTSGREQLSIGTRLLSPGDKPACCQNVPSRESYTHHSDSAPENTHWAAKDTLVGRVQGRPACNLPCSFYPGEKGQRETLPGVTSCSGSTSLDHFLQCWCPDALLGSQSDCGLGAKEPHTSHEVTPASCRLQLSTHHDWGGLKDTRQQVLPDFKATGHVC